MPINLISSLSKKHLFIFLGIIVLITGLFLLFRENLIKPILPSEKPTLLTLTSPLPGVGVIIDGTSGEADPTSQKLIPLTLKIAPGQHRVEAFKKGYQTKVFTPNLLSNQENKYEIILQPIRSFTLQKLPTDKNPISFGWFDDKKVIYASGPPLNVIRETDVEKTRTLFVYPDGGKVYWAHQGIALIQKDEKLSLFTPNKPLLSLSFTSSLVSISPRGKKIAYLKAENLFIEDFSLGSLKKEGYSLPFEESLKQIAWGPEESFLLLTTSSTATTHLYLLDLISGERRLLSSGFISQAQFSHSGEKIAYLDEKNLYVINFRGEVLKTISLSISTFIARFVWLENQEILLIEKINQGVVEELDNFWLVLLSDDEKFSLGVSAPISGRISFSFLPQTSPSGKKVLFLENNGPLWILDLTH